MTSPGPAAVQIAAHAQAQPPTLGQGRLICIDGPSGSGKTTLAERLARVVPATVVHTDQLCPGWNGLPAVPAILANLLRPLAAGTTGRYREWDWIRDRLGDSVDVEPASVLIVEGLGAGARSLREWTTTLVWLDARAEVRRTRAFERDGDYFRDQWDPWAAAEAAYFSAESVGDRADLCFRTG